MYWIPRAQPLACEILIVENVPLESDTCLEWSRKIHRDSRVDDISVSLATTMFVQPREVLFQSGNYLTDLDAQRLLAQIPQRVIFAPLKVMEPVNSTSHNFAGINRSDRYVRQHLGRLVKSGLEGPQRHLLRRHWPPATMKKPVCLFQWHGSLYDSIVFGVDENARAPSEMATAKLILYPALQ